MGGISYGTQEEFNFRQTIFEENSVEYARINADKNNTFTVGHNFMSTWTKDEYKKLLGYKAPKSENLEAQVENPTEPSMESAQFIQKGGNLQSLSEQELVSCDTSSHGCGGGLQSYGMDYVASNGQVTEAEYPYTSGKGD